MAATELDDVSALLQRVLPDPSGFAERLMDQFVSRWGVTSPGRSNFTAATGRPEDVSEPPVVLAPRYVPHSLDALADSNVLLASALGACDCWGLQDDCVVCKGKGEPGWIQPDLELFQVFVGPAVARLADAGLVERHGPSAGKTTQDRDRQGEAHE